MKILFLTPSLEFEFAGHALYDFMVEFGKHADCKYFGVGWPDYVDKLSTTEVIKKLYGDDEPDWVFGYVYKTDFNFKTVYWMYDVHVDPDALIERMNRVLDLGLLRTLYTTSYFKTKEDFKKASLLPSMDVCMDEGILIPAPKSYLVDQFTTNKRLFLFSVDPWRYYPLENREIDVALIGAIGRFYPLRLKIFETLSKADELLPGRNILISHSPNIAEVRADYRKVLNEPKFHKKWIVGEEYINTLCNSKIVICTPGFTGLPVLKYVEAMMSGALMMGSEPWHADKMHLEDGRNYIKIDEINFLEKIKYYLENDDERKAIAKRGYETALKYHTNEVRVKEVIKILEELS